MKGKNVWIAGILAVLAVAGSAWCGLRSLALAQFTGEKAAQIAGDALGVTVEVESISIDSLHSLTGRNIALYDKQAQIIAEVEEATVGFRLFSLIDENPLDVLKSVSLKNPKAYLREREDGSLNVNDLMSEGKSETQFSFEVEVENGSLGIQSYRLPEEILIENINGAAECSDSLTEFHVSGENKGVNIKGSGRVEGERLSVRGDLQDLRLENYLHMIPKDTLPENFAIISGHITEADINLLKNGDVLTYTATAECAGAKVTVEDTPIDITGLFRLNEKELRLFADGVAKGQKAHVQGVVSLVETPAFDLDVTSEGFDVSEIFPVVGFRGNIAFEAKVGGSFSAPIVDGDFRAKRGVYDGIVLRDAFLHAHYAENNLAVTKLRAKVLGGKVTGEGELALKDMIYAANLKAWDLSLEAAKASLPDILGDLPQTTGKANFDLGITGKGLEAENASVFGSVSARKVLVQNITLDEVDLSFFMANKKLEIDYLSLLLPQKSRIGLEGAFDLGNTHEKSAIDCAFYGQHVDLALLQQFVPQGEISGWGDFRGKIAGSFDNPEVEAHLSGIMGKLFEQPYDSFIASVSGSLDKIGIDDFKLHKDGKEVWIAAGEVGLTGEKKINLRVDTMGARMEDIVRLVAPEQPLTGNMDNVITVTGTLDDPQVVGYIHLYRGSYHGMLINGMDGDYTVDGNIITLQDFRIRTPLIDMQANGDLDLATNALKMAVNVFDIDMRRMKNSFPYPVEGHGVFKGNIDGTLDAPHFNGILDSEKIVLNDVVITDVHGQVAYDTGTVAVRNFSFNQGTGTYQLHAYMNMNNKRLHGTVNVEEADIAALAALANQKTSLLEGKLYSNILFSGTTSNVAISMEGKMPQGTVGGYDVHDAVFDIDLESRSIHVKKLSASQGESGSLSFVGSISNRIIEGNLEATNLDAGLFTKVAGVGTKVIGLVDLNAKFSGTTRSPLAEINLAIKDGGIQGSTFDALTGKINIRNGTVGIEKLVVQKEAVGKVYQASCVGTIPFKALTAKNTAELPPNEQVNLRFSLDDADLSLLPTLSKEIEWAVGATAGSFSVTGTASDPKLNGVITVDNGGVKLRSLHKPVENVQFLVTLNGDSVRLDQFSGNLGKGNFLATGSVNIGNLTPSKYSCTLSLNALEIESDAFRGPLSGEFKLTEEKINTPRGEKLFPKIAGHLDIDKCNISVPSVPDSEGEMPAILLDVSVNLGSDVHCYTPYLYDMYVVGSANFGGSTRFPKATGSFFVQQGGTINFMKTVFKIREGEAYFNQIGSFLPNILFVADARVARTNVFLTLEGPLNDMTKKLTSSPEMSETEILQLITLRSDPKTAQDTKMEDLLSLGLQMTVLSEVESSLRNMLLLDTFTISRGRGSLYSHSRTEENEFNILMGKYVTDRLMVRYSRSMGGVSDDRYGFQYDLNERIGLTMEREGNEYLFGVEARVKF